MNLCMYMYFTCKTYLYNNLCYNICADLFFIPIKFKITDFGTPKLNLVICQWSKVLSVPDKIYNMHLLKGILHSAIWIENILNFILINVRSDLKLKSNMNSIRNSIFNHYHFTHYLILDQKFMLCCAINSQCFAFSSVLFG